MGGKTCKSAVAREGGRGIEDGSCVGRRGRKVDWGEGMERWVDGNERQFAVLWLVECWLSGCLILLLPNEAILPWP